MSDSLSHLLADHHESEILACQTIQLVALPGTAEFKVTRELLERLILEAFITGALCERSNPLNDQV